MKIKKKRKKDNILYKYNIRKSVLILLRCMIVAMITYYLYAYHHKYGSFYSDDSRLVSYKISDYVDIKGDMVYLKNMNNSIISYFDSKQESIMNNDNLLSTNVTKSLNGNILSVMISYIIDGKDGNYEEVLTLNVNLKEDRVIENDELLSMLLVIKRLVLVSLMIIVRNI